jgi:hypothetical protein
MAKEPVEAPFCILFGHRKRLVSAIRRRKEVTGLKTEANAGVNTGKRVAIGLLFATSAIIALMGLLFCVYSMINNVQLMVINTSIPGAAFGAIIAFLGVRYFLAVRKLRKSVYRVGTQFSWSNFRKQH